MRFIPNLQHLELADSDLQQDLESWYKMSDPEFMKTAQELIVDRVVTLWPTIIIIPCFKHSLTPEQQSRFGWGKFNLTDFNEIFMQHYFGCDRLVAPLQERHNMVQHMPIEWHETVADLVCQSITTGRRPPQMPRINQLPALTHDISTYVA